ncbi:MAG: cupin domain-containing protein [Solirubrobacteraceae bacterium]
MSAVDRAGAWTAAEPPSISFQLAHLDGASWERGTGTLAALELRDLRLGAASNGALGAWHLRVAADAVEPELAQGAHGLDFQFLYLIAGEAEIEHADGFTVSLVSSDAAMLSAGLSHRARLSGDFEAIVFTAPAHPQTPSAGGGWSDDGPPRYLTDGEQAFERRGLRSFFEYRDLGTDEPTAGRVHANVLRALEPQEAGTGWHFHSMGQLVFVLSGVAEVNVAGHGHIITGAGDSMCVGAGIAHNVHSFTADYSLIEFCIPSEYDTVAVELV